MFVFGGANLDLAASLFEPELEGIDQSLSFFPGENKIIDDNLEVPAFFKIGFL